MKAPTLTLTPIPYWHIRCMVMGYALAIELPVLLAVLEYGSGGPTQSIGMGSVQEMGRLTR